MTYFKISFLKFNFTLISSFEKCIFLYFVSWDLRPTDNLICIHMSLEKGHKRKKKGLKLVSRLKSDPLRNQIQPVTKGTNKQICIRGHISNRFSHAYPMVRLPEENLIDNCLPRGRVALSMWTICRLVWPDFQLKGRTETRNQFRWSLKRTLDANGTSLI